MTLKEKKKKAAELLRSEVGKALVARAAGKLRASGKTDHDDVVDAAYEVAENLCPTDELAETVDEAADGVESLYSMLQDAAFLKIDKLVGGNTGVDAETVEKAEKLLRRLRAN